ncbi:MAG: hypothetical protein CMN29_06920 [Sandaracinus sp.]|nr:hypothetical protein [Sandaracinus sp.]
MAAVADEGPEAPLTHVSREAKKRGLRPGLAQGLARDLVPDLRTGVIGPADLAALETELLRALRTFSPRVERAEERSGAFFVDPTGLEGIYGGAEGWAETVHRYLAGRGFVAAVVVGFRRHRALALALGARGPRVLHSREDERTASDAIPLRALGWPEALCEPLAMLGVETLGAFLALPRGELMNRLGPEAAALHARFGDDATLPMQPVQPEAERRVGRELSPALADRDGLLFASKGVLDELLAQLEARGERLEALTLELHLERYGPGCALEDDERRLEERITSAEPTNDARTWLELLRLRLAERELRAPVEHLVLEADSARAEHRQLSTEGERPRRDREAGSRALARLRATYGERSVVRARVQDAHLPEARVRFEPLRRLPEPRPLRRHDLRSGPPVPLPSAAPAAPAGAGPSSAPPPARVPSSRAPVGAAQLAPASHTLLRGAGGPGHPFTARLAEPGLRADGTDRADPAERAKKPTDELDERPDDARTEATPHAATQHAASQHAATRPEASQHEATRPEATRPETARAAAPWMVAPTDAAEHESFRGAHPSAIDEPGAAASAGPPARLQRRLWPAPVRLRAEGGWPWLDGAPAERLQGPHRVSGGWWGAPASDGALRETERDYYYAEARSGALYWIYFDRVRERWFARGVVD